MSLKSVDVQLSLSRTSETKNIQHVLNHKQEWDQNQLGQFAEKKLVKERHQSTKLQESAEMHIRDEHQQRSKNNSKNQQNAKEEPENGSFHCNIHPYKGKNIDISL